MLSSNRFETFPRTILVPLDECESSHNHRMEVVMTLMSEYTYFRGQQLRRRCDLDRLRNANSWIELTPGWASIGRWALQANLRHACDYAQVHVSI
jgi:hypothetical protein